MFAFLLLVLSMDTSSSHRSRSELGAHHSLSEIISYVAGLFCSIPTGVWTLLHEMKFFPVGMKTGIGLSAAALLTTVVYIPLDHRRRKATPVEAPINQNA